MSMQITNMTPHQIVVVGQGGEVLLSIAPSGQVARVGQTREIVGEVNGLPIYRSTYGEVTGLPEAQDGVALIVSAMVRLATPGRGDIYSPGELVRDAAGQPIGCRGLEGNV